MTTDERRKLDAMVVRCTCGGTRWRPDGPDGERCVDCGKWSPCSVAVLDARQ
jgi:hypothetical protein